MDAGIGAVCFPAIEIGLRFFETLEAFSFERSSLRVSDARFHFSFAIRILDPARQGYRSVVGEHVAIEWVQGGVVDIGTSTPSLRLSRTTTRVLPPSRRKAFSWSSAQMRELERKVRRRTDLRL